MPYPTGIIATASGIEAQSPKIVKITNKNLNICMSKETKISVFMLGQTYVMLILRE